MNNKELVSYHSARLELTSPTAMPLASAFLWNSQMMIQVSCRGYATAQFMQPEPAKYAHAPNLEAKTFMQPEQPYYAHHPGRFFYLKDHENSQLFSAPYEPVRNKPDEFSFIAGPHNIAWRVINDGIQIDLDLSLCKDRPAELWQVTVTNLSDRQRNLSLTPYFPVGYMSWMNQSGAYHSRLQAVICRCVTPYQKYTDYFKNKDHKDLTYFLADRQPDSWEVRQSQFEGEGGLHSPSALQAPHLSNSDAVYETPAATLQYHIELAPAHNQSFKFIFGPALDEQEVNEIRQQYFGSSTAFDQAINDYAAYIAQGQSGLEISTPNPELDNFVNHWLARQVFYHGDVNRLSTAPQTRNYLQDNMGMSYIKPKRARQAFLYALAQQHRSGAMPDGILLNDDAELKYINQVPHMDHCVWLPICLGAYLDETDDYELMHERIAFADSGEPLTAAEHIDLAMRWLFEKRDTRGLNYIEQGDWCDPMNMVGYQGRGVSGWLTLATAYASKLWAQISTHLERHEQAAEFQANAAACNSAVNTHLWRSNWYARGITDDGALFGTANDQQGRIFLNPQAWAILSGAADAEQQASLIESVEEQLETPYGVEMLAPAFTAMRDDIGRVTQKHPGSAENGSVYNHAAAFYVYALYQIGHADRAFRLLMQMLPNSDAQDLLQRGQLPTFIPNYYRGAYRLFPRTAGRSSQLFNTGTVHWFYRCLMDGLFGLRGCREGLRIQPQLPSDWPEASVIRHFRGAVFDVKIKRDTHLEQVTIRVDEEVLNEPLIRDVQAGQRYMVNVRIP